MSTWDPNPRQLMVLGWDEEMREGREKEGRNDGKRGIDGRKREKIRRNDGKKGIGEGEEREKRGIEERAKEGRKGREKEGRVE